MTFDETITILDICKAEWPQSFTGLTRQDSEARLNLWAEMFRDDSAVIVGAAVKTIIAAGNREFAPGVGAIKEQIRKMTAGREDMTEAEAWARIRKAISNGIYGASDEFEKLPPILQRLVGSPAQLRDWAQMDTAAVQSVVASNVQRAFKTMQAREQEEAKVPADVKALCGEAFGFELDKPAPAALGDGYGVS